MTDEHFEQAPINNNDTMPKGMIVAWVFVFVGVVMGSWDYLGFYETSAGYLARFGFGTAILAGGYILARSLTGHKD